MIKIKIKYQFSFLVLCLLGIVIGLISFLMFDHEKQSLINERQLRGKTLVRNLATASAEAILSDNELNLFSYCTDIIEHEEDAKYVIIANSKGIILAHNKPEFVGKTCDDQLCDSLLKSDNLLIIPTMYKGEQLYDYSMPMIIAGKKIGFIRVLMSNESIIRKMENLQKEILQLSLFVLAIGLISTLLLVHFLVKPIAQLSEGALLIGSGNFSHRIRVKSNNEIGELAQAFNVMGESLQTRKNQLASLNETTQALNTTLEQDTLLKNSLQAINDIITPKQCLLCLLIDDTLKVKEYSGITENVSLLNTPLALPEDIQNSLFSKQKAQIFSAEKLQSTFEPGAFPAIDSGWEILISPLVYEDKTKGAFFLLGKEKNAGFSESDREFSEIIAASTTISLLNIELLEETAEKTRMEAELKTAEVVQKTLFPKEPVVTDSIEVYGYFKSASETGGDWYGYIDDAENDRLSIFMGDVTGHGVPAALVTATANSFITTMGILRKRFDAFSDNLKINPDGSSEATPLPAPLSPSFLLSLLNQIILKSTEGKLVMTFFASTFDLKNRKVYFANAGHEMPIIIRTEQGNKPESLSASGTRLGDKEGVTFEQNVSEIDSGDVIIFYTDGITECHNVSGDEYGNRRFLRKIKKTASMNASEILDSLVNDVNAFRGEEPLNDDITLVVAKIL